MKLTASHTDNDSYSGKINATSSIVDSQLETTEFSAACSLSHVKHIAAALCSLYSDQIHPHADSLLAGDLNMYQMSLYLTLAC